MLDQAKMVLMQVNSNVRPFSSHFAGFAILNKKDYNALILTPRIKGSIS